MKPEELEQAQAEMRERVKLRRPTRRKKLYGKARLRHERKVRRMQNRRYHDKKKAAVREQKRLEREQQRQEQERRRQQRAERLAALEKIAAEKAEQKKVRAFNNLSHNARRGRSYEQVYAAGYAAGFQAGKEFAAGTATESPVARTATTE